jgi:hypothetical protein
MPDEIHEITEIFECDVAEMGGAHEHPLTTLLRLDDVTIQRVTEGDDDPKFATFVISSGKSKNDRNWRPEIFEKVVEQINSADEPVVGYLGHIHPNDEGYAFPDIQLQWLKARLEMASDRARLIAKAYVLPETKARDYLKRRLVKTVSWSGKAAMRPLKGGGHDIVDFDLESIDLSRPRKAGMSAVLVGGLTSEMENEGGSVKPEEIAALQENELRAHNPSLVTTIEDSAKAPLKEKVTEIEADGEQGKEALTTLAKVREALGLDENGDLLEALGNLVAKSKDIAKEARTKYLDTVLEKKFKDEPTRNLARRLIVTEMATGEYVTEMDSVENDEDLEKKTDEVVNKVIDNDPDLKKMVSEMEGSGGRSFSGGDARKTRKIEAGYENDNITVTKVRRR